MLAVVQTACVVRVGAGPGLTRPHWTRRPRERQADEVKVAGSESRPEPRAAMAEREIILVASCYPIHQIIRIAIFIFGMGCMSASFIRNLTTDCFKMKLRL